MRDTFFEDFEIAMKVVIVGNGSVGKSSMIQRFCRGIFTRDYKKTIGVDFLERVMTIEGSAVRLMLWDTAGQEEFDAITRTYYRGAAACVLACSVTDKESFLALPKWKAKVCRECGDIPMVLVANKIDLLKQAVVDSSELESMSRALNIPKLFRTSVKEDLNVNSVFSFLASAYVQASLCPTPPPPQDEDDEENPHDFSNGHSLVLPSTPPTPTPKVKNRLSAVLFGFHRGNNNQTKTHSLNIAKNNKLNATKMNNHHHHAGSPLLHNGVGVKKSSPVILTSATSLPPLSQIPPSNSKSFFSSKKQNGNGPTSPRLSHNNTNGYHLQYPTPVKKVVGMKGPNNGNGFMAQEVSIRHAPAHLRGHINGQQGVGGGVGYYRSTTNGAGRPTTAYYVDPPSRWNNGDVPFRLDSSTDHHHHGFHRKSRRDSSCSIL